MESKLLTDPDLYEDNSLREQSYQRRSLTKMKFLEVENASLRMRIRDLDKTLNINKGIMKDLVESSSLN